jgi:hypothetical protein
VDVEDPSTFGTAVEVECKLVPTLSVVEVAAVAPVDENVLAELGGTDGPAEASSKGDGLGWFVVSKEGASNAWLNWLSC